MMGNMVENNKPSILWRIVEGTASIVLKKIFRISFSESQWEGLMQFVKFGIVGLSNTVISYVIYVAALLLFQENGWLVNVDYLVAQVIAFVLSVLWSFYWNNKYVFKQDEDEERNILQALLKTYISYAFTGLFLNSVLSWIWVEIVHIPKLFAPIINLLISVPLNYVMNKFWAFGKKNEKK